MKIKISPSLLAADFSALKSEVEEVEKAGADWLHLDIMDGHFVPNISYGPAIVKAIRKHTGLFFDVHLMISEPLKYIPDFADAGADLIVFHYESVENPKEAIDLIKKLGKKVGIALKPKTDIKVLDKFINELDMVLIMAVEPGFGGQSFMEDMMPKIRYLREKSPKIDIQVDGGINEHTAKISVEAGANILVAGTYVFGSPDYKKAISSLK